MLVPTRIVVRSTVDRGRENKGAPHSIWSNKFANYLKSRKCLVFGIGPGSWEPWQKSWSGLEFANYLNSEQKPVWVRKHYAEENMVCIPDTEPVKFGTNKPLGSYWIDKYEVSNGEYAEFIAAGGYLQEALWGFERILYP